LEEERDHHRRVHRRPGPASAPSSVAEAAPKKGAVVGLLGGTIYDVATRNKH
jgi:hypothetical protein